MHDYMPGFADATTWNTADSERTRLERIADALRLRAKLLQLLAAQMKRRVRALVLCAIQERLLDALAVATNSLHATAP